MTSWVVIPAWARIVHRTTSPLPREWQHLGTPAVRSGGHARASTHCPDNPLLLVYEQHPLHQPTQWVHGFTMLTAEQRAQWEHEWLRELVRAGQDTDLPTAA